MSKRFEGLDDVQWSLLEPSLPTWYKAGKRGPGRPPTYFRNILNTILWILNGGAKWKDVPTGPQWAPRSTSHRWLGLWTVDGTWRRMAGQILGTAYNLGLIDLERGSVDGMFVSGKGGGDDVDYGFKGKGSTIHHLCDNNGRSLAIKTTPANTDERKLVMELLDAFVIHTGKVGRPPKKVKALQGDKGYQDKNLHRKLKRRGIAPKISHKQQKGKKRGRPCSKPIDRFKIERCHAWLQKRFRRICTKWERRRIYWNGLVQFALVLSWVPIILQTLTGG